MNALMLVFFQQKKSKLTLVRSRFVHGQGTSITSNSITQPLSFETAVSRILSTDIK